MVARDESRLMARVARLYHESGLTQSAIADRLGLSQAKVSRLLRAAVDAGIVTVTVRVPTGVHAELEEALEQRFGLAEAVVVSVGAGASSDDPDDVALLRALGEAAAQVLENTLRAGDVVGISSWSATLLATVDAMRPVSTTSDVHVVQVLGGVGSPEAEVHATALTRRFARTVNGTSVLLPVPGVVGSASARAVLEADEHVRRTVEWFPRLTVALVGIGALEPSPLLARSGNVFTDAELREVESLGGVGDVCLRFFDHAGRPLESSLDERVIGLSLEQLAAVPRSIAVAGGLRKVPAIRGALRGGFVTHLITDEATAVGLLADDPRGTP